MISHFKQLKYVPVDKIEFNTIVRTIHARGGRIYLEQFHKVLHGKIGFDGFIVDKIKFVELTCYYKGEYATFIIDKTSGKKKDAIVGCSAGMNAYNICRRMMTSEENSLVPVLVNENDLFEGKNVKPFSTSPILYMNPKYEGKENKAYGYDMNSAYSFAMLQDMPDTREMVNVDAKCYNPGYLKKNQIGFDDHGNLLEVGDYALYRFKKIPSPFKHFVEYYFNLKSNAKNPTDRERAKRVLNLAVGYFQRKNPFIRATVVSRANHIIESLMDENTIYCNTDSIVSLKKRPDLEIGDNIGQWKIDHKGIFKYIGMNYQWNKEIPAYRGVPKEWFKKGFDILHDPLPVNGNLYELDYETFLIRKVKL